MCPDYVFTQFYIYVCVIYTTNFIISLGNFKFNKILKIKPNLSILANHHPRPYSKSMSKKGTYFIFGRHAVLSALKNPERSAIRLLIAGKADEEITAAASGKNLRFETLEPKDLERLLPQGAVSQGLALEVEPLRDGFVEDLKPVDGQKNLILALDQVTDPHNVGAIFRSAAAFGVKAILTQDRHAPEESGVLAKAASGALDLVPWVRVTNLARALDDLFEMGYWRAGLEGSADKTVAEVDLGDNLVLIMGAEGKGLRPLTLEKCDILAKIPIAGKMESLNVSNAAAVALYELSKI